jgi:hypothetical protein
MIPVATIHILAPALSMYDAYNGLVPPNCGHPIAKTIRICVGGLMR